jgi:hypothetical protein
MQIVSWRQSLFKPAICRHYHCQVRDQPIAATWLGFRIGKP